MTHYFQDDLFGSGWLSLLLVLISVVIWIYGLVYLRKKQYQSVCGMVEVIWLIASLRVCINTDFCFMICGIGQTEAWLPSYISWSLGKAISMPFIDASILSFSLLIPLNRASISVSKPIKFYCLIGVVSGIVAVLLTHYTWMLILQHWLTNSLCPVLR
jgi:hypothetical protein